MKKLRVVQIGTAHDHAPMTLETLEMLSDYYEILGIAEPDEQYKHMLSTPPFNRFRQYSAEQALNLDKLDAVIVETDELTSTYWAQRALDKGLAVHLDKPGSPDIATFRKMIDTAKSRDIPLQLGYMYRYNPLIQKYLEQAKQGKFGDLMCVEAHMSTRHDAKKRQWLSRFPGGMMFFLGCHLVDIVMLFMGEPKEIIPFNAYTGNENVNGALDYAFAVLKYDTGVSFIKANASEVNGFNRRQIVISGTNGTVEIKPTEVFAFKNSNTTGCNEAFLDKSSSQWRNCSNSYQTEPFDRYSAMMEDFALIAAREKKNPYTYDYEMKVFENVMKCCGIDIDK